MNIESIKKMVEEAVPSLENDTELRYLLSIIKKADKAIEQLEKAIEKLGEMDDPDKIKKFASKALKAIRGN